MSNRRTALKKRIDHSKCYRYDENSFDTNVDNKSCRIPRSKNGEIVLGNEVDSLHLQKKSYKSQTSKSS